MADNTAGNDEFLLLTDENGNYFAIPRGTVEKYKATGEQRDQIEQALGEDVSGFSMYQQHINEFRTSTYQAERRQEAAQERLIRSARSEQEDSPTAGAEASGNSLGQMLTGMWRSLPFLRSSTPRP